MIADEVLYAQTLAGDRAALAELVERYHGPLLKYLGRVTGHAQTAEDLVQDVFVRLITHRGLPPTRFRPWAYRIASNLATDTYRAPGYYREQDPLPESETGEEELSTCDDPAAGVLHEDDQRRVSSLLQRLPPNQRQVIVLRFYHDLPLEEIAEVIGCPLGTVKSRLYKGLDHARQLMEEEEACYDRAR